MCTFTVILSCVVTAGYALVSCWLIYGGCACGWCRGGDVLVSNNCFFYNKTQQHHFWNFILMTQCKLYACGGCGGGSQQREVADGADGADVVFTDTGQANVSYYSISHRSSNSGV